MRLGDANYRDAPGRDEPTRLSGVCGHDPWDAPYGAGNPHDDEVPAWVDEDPDAVAQWDAYEAMGLF